jgi:hypothetical protein
MHFYTNQKAISMSLQYCYETSLNRNSFTHRLQNHAYIYIHTYITSLQYLQLRLVRNITTMSSSSSLSSHIEQELSNHQHIPVPVQNTSDHSYRKLDIANVPDRTQGKHTTAQWINDPITGREKFQLIIPIEGFRPSEVDDLLFAHDCI